MDQKDLYELIEADRLKEVLAQLAIRYAGSKFEQSVRHQAARLQELEKSMHEGILSAEAYLLEKNRIRKAIIALVEGEDLTEIWRPGLRTPLIAIFTLVVVVIGAVFFWRQGGPFPKSITAPSEKPDAAVKADLVAKISAALAGRTFSFTHNELRFTQDREYRSGLAYLKRRYTWTADVTVSMEGPKVVYQKSDSVLEITLEKIKLLPDFPIKNKRSATVTNSLWIEETAKDGSFWETVETRTGPLIDEQFRKNEDLRVLVKDRGEAVVKSAVEQSLGASAVEVAAVKVNLPELVLLDNGKVAL